MPLNPLNPTKTATAAATASGNTTLVTGAAGQVFTVLGYEIQATSNVAVAAGAVVTVDLKDATTSLGCQHVFFAPTTAVTTGGPNPLTSGWIGVPYGAIRTSPGNNLNLSLSAALTSGGVQATCIYTQENSPL